MNNAVLSTEYPQFASRLEALGYHVIPSGEIPCKMPYERRHADLQCLILNDTAFVLSCCTGLSEALCGTYRVVACGGSFSASYPDHVCLNAVQLKNRLICRVASLDEAVKDYCRKQGFALINVNQGYAKCSCAVVSDNAVITADQSILRALRNAEIDVLPTGQGSVALAGADYGFIGGASGYDQENHTLYFCGNICAHPDHDRIRSFCEAHGTRIVSLSNDYLIDIGGILFC